MKHVSRPTCNVKQHLGNVFMAVGARVFFTGHGSEAPYFISEGIP